MRARVAQISRYILFHPNIDITETNNDHHRVGRRATQMLDRVVAQFELGFWDEVASKQLKAHNNAIVFAKLYQVAPI